MYVASHLGKLLKMQASNVAVFHSLQLEIRIFKESSLQLDYSPCQQLLALQLLNKFILFQILSNFTKFKVVSKK